MMPGDGESKIGGTGTGDGKSSAVSRMWGPPKFASNHLLKVVRVLSIVV
jgi:hypothetical protein